MKKIISGGIFLISGVVLFLGSYIPAAIVAANLGGWTTPPVWLGTALEITGGTYLWNGSIIMIVVGIILILLGCFGEDVVKLFNRRKPVLEDSSKEAYNM